MMERNTHTQQREWVGGWVCFFFLCREAHAYSYCIPSPSLTLNQAATRSSSRTCKCIISPPFSHPPTHPPTYLPTYSPYNVTEEVVRKAFGFCERIKTISTRTHPPTHPPTHLPTYSPYNVTEDVVRDAFGFCGKIKTIRLAMWQHTQQQKGFCYIAFEKEGSADIAVKKQGSITVGGTSLLPPTHPPTHPRTS